MKRDLIKYLLRKDAAGREIAAAGWVRTRRDSKGGFSFLELNDGSCLANLQVVADGSLPNYEADILRLHPGSSVRVEGLLVASQGGEQAVELQARAVTVYGFCPPEDYPLQKQRVSFERLREIAHLRPRTNTFGAIARLRHELIVATHRFFHERDFCYLQTPIVTASDCEGAGAMFQVTTLDLDRPPRADDGRIRYADDFFGRRASLTVSGQLEAETYACALGRVYTFGPTFRAENSNTRRHLAEFWMLEPEMAFADLADDADLGEAYLHAVLLHVLEHSREDLAFFDQRIAPGLLAGLEKLARQPFARISYTEAIERLERSGQAFEFPVRWGMDMQSEHERYLTEKEFQGPVTVIDFPKEIKSFYMRVNDDGRTVAAMDMLVPGVGEIIGGSQREERLDVLDARLVELGLNPADYWWYRDLRRFGTVPHAGFGLGFERLVQFCTGMHNIRDVIPFPRTPNAIEF